MLCRKHTEIMFITADTGNCESCHAKIGSSNYKLCKKCSNELNQCRMCRVFIAATKIIKTAN